MTKSLLNLLPIKVLSLIFLLSISSCSSSQKTSTKGKDGKKEGKPEWVMSRPVDRNYYQGIGVAMVNNYTQGHVEEAKKKALNDIISEISVNVKSTSMMQQIEQNEELNSMYQSLTNVSAENSIEGFELAASWGDEKEYWVYYRLSKELYNRNKLRRVDRAKNIGSQYYESGLASVKSGNVGRAYQDFVKGFVSMKEYLDEEVTILTDNGVEYLVDVLLSELIELNRNLNITSEVTTLKTKVGSRVDKNIPVNVSYKGQPIELTLRSRFIRGSGEMNPTSMTDANGNATINIQRISGGENIQTLEISPDIEGMTGEEIGQQLMTTLLRLKSDVPSVRISIEAQKIIAFYELEENKFGKSIPESSFSKAVKKLMTDGAYTFTTNKSQAEVVIKLSIVAKKGEEHLLKNSTLYVTYLDCFVTITGTSNGNQLFYKGFNGIKGSRSGSFDQALQHAEGLALDRFEKELMPEIGNVDL